MASQVQTERQRNPNSPYLEPGHQVTPAKFRWPFGLNIFNVESIELPPLTAENIQLKDALVKLSKLCSDQEIAEDDSLMDITSKITNSLRSLVTANVQPKTPQRARINRILSDIGKSDGKSDGF
jgi:hypothetical protein